MGRKARIGAGLAASGEVESGCGMFARRATDCKLLWLDELQFKVDGQAERPGVPGEEIRGAARINAAGALKRENQTGRCGESWGWTWGLEGLASQCLILWGSLPKGWRPYSGGTSGKIWRR